MRIPKIAVTMAAVLAMAAVAYASPIFGTWKGELNGRAITITVSYSNHQTGVAMTSGGRAMTVSNPAFPKGGPPLDLTFQSGGELYQLSTSNGAEGTLKVTAEGKTTTIQVVKSSPAK